jgi:hypothetical protein
MGRANTIDIGLYAWDSPWLERYADESLTAGRQLLPLDCTVGLCLVKPIIAVYL